MIGQTISHYRVLEKIGEGGMGLVYLAEDSMLRRKVALKFLPDYLQEDETAHKRFIREARSAAALDHPFICHIHEVGEVEGRDFIAMEYVEGETLRDTLKEGPLALNDALHIANELIDALEKAHSQGIVHRDLKPANIMITPDGHIKVMDFGLAKRVSVAGTPEQDITAQVTQALTQAGTALGTLTYMSPEQACGESVDTRSDIFSFGIVLYEMLTGKNPFREGSPIRTFSAILNKPAPLVSQGKRGVSAELEDLVAKMLEKEPEKRCQSVAEVRAELEAVEARSYLRIWPGLSLFWRWSLTTAGILLLSGMALQLGFIDFSWLPEEVNDGISLSRHSLAVLPFENLTGDSVLDSWASGLTNVLTSELASLGNWRRLPSYWTVRVYSNSGKPLPQIGEELDVELLIEGSFLPGEGVQLKVVLLEASDDSERWSKTYRRKNLELQSIQIQVVRDIAEQLEIDLTPAQNKQLEKGTGNSEAYHAYLHGRSLLPGREMEAAANEFSRAIELDPDYAKAYSGRAYSYGLIAGWGLKRPTDYWTKARIDARSALGLDESLAEARSVLGMAANMFEYKWMNSEDEHRLAIEGDPYNPTFYHYLAYLQASLGQFEKAHQTGSDALELDPRSRSNRTAVGFIHFLAGDYDEAVRRLNQVVTIHPNYLYAHYWLFLCYHKLERYEDAFREFFTCQEINAAKGDEWRQTILTELKQVYDESGYKAALNHHAHRLVERRETEYVHATTILYAYTAAENRDLALQWLRTSYVEKDASVAYLNIHPMWDLFRDDPIYQNLLAQLNFPEN